MDPGPYEAIADVYDVWCAEVTEDVAFYRAACEGAEGPVVELGAGSGRIAVPVALDGHHVVAVDRSPAMLGRLDALATAAGVRDAIQLVQADIEDVDLPPTDRVIAPFRTLLHLPTTDRRLGGAAGRGRLRARRGGRRLRRRALRGARRRLGLDRRGAVGLASR